MRKSKTFSAYAPVERAAILESAASSSGTGFHVLASQCMLMFCECSVGLVVSIPALH